MKYYMSSTSTKKWPHRPLIMACWPPGKLALETTCSVLKWPEVSALVNAYIVRFPSFFSSSKTGEENTICFIKVRGLTTAIMHPCCITPAGACSAGPLSLHLSHAGRLSTSQPAARQLAVIGTLPWLSWERSEGLRSTTDGLPSPPIRESSPRGVGERWGWVGRRKGEEEKEFTSSATLSPDQNGWWRSLFPLLPNSPFASAELSLFANCE